MKKIIKNESPRWFENWKTTFEATNGRKPHYKDDFAVDSPDGQARRRDLRSALVREQGYICCYCMKKITINNSHTEHFWPKESFGDIDLEYRNLFASCNGIEVVLQEDNNCGHRKDNWFDADMVPMTNDSIESMFKYTIDGKISSIRGHAKADIANKMIRNMGLDKYHVIRNRADAIEASEVCDDEEYSDEDIRNFINYYSHKNETGEYDEYCRAIIDCLLERL